MVQSTTDIWFTVFLMKEKNEPIADYEILSGGTRRKAKFSFDFTDKEWIKLKLEFNKSIFTTIKYGLEEIKDLVH